MQAVVLRDIRDLRTEEYEVPHLTEDSHDVLVKIERVGVCGSDVHYYETGHIGSQVVQYPFVLGHECSGKVAEVGSKVKRVKVGDKVAVEPAVVCHNCDQCLAGRENTCRNLRFLGCPGQLGGCLCEYIVMPEDSLYPLQGRITLEQAVLCEPLSIGIYSVRQAAMERNCRIAILGAGPIGLSVLAGAQAQSVGSVYVTDLIDNRTVMAQKGGATWSGNPEQQDIVDAILSQQPGGMDVVFECAGQQDTIDQAIELLKPGGKLMLIGIPRQERISLVIDKARRKEISLINVRRQNNCMQPAIDLIASGKVDVGYMITHRFGLQQTTEAFDLVADYRDGVLKALIEI